MKVQPELKNSLPRFPQGGAANYLFHTVPYAITRCPVLFYMVFGDMILDSAGLLW